MSDTTPTKKYWPLIGCLQCSFLSLIPVQLINSTVIREFLPCNQLIAVIRELSSIIFFSGAYSRDLYLGAIIWELITEDLISGGIYPGGLYPGTYMRGLLIGGL